MNYHFCLLLAQDVQFSDLGRRIRDGSGGFTAANILFLLVVLLVVAGSAWLLSRYLKGRDRRGYHSPRVLFKELCKSHNLDRNDCRLLKKLARGHRLRQPSLLFLEPDRFDSGPVKDNLAAYRADFQKLRDRLFGRRFDDVATTPS